jgi:3-methyladenine DNA glycosylase AlkC
MAVAQHGLEAFEESLELLKEMTKRGTSEFDVRPFLEADQARALQILTPWVQDENLHVRRWLSEGTRPRLPWGLQLKQLVAEPRPTFPILTALRDDPEEYVRRSVANHLNDIAKDHPDLVAEIAHEWLKDAPASRQKLIRHACRTRIKNGHTEALRAFGVSAPMIEAPVITIKTPQVQLGGGVEFSAVISSTSDKPQKIILDYVVHFQKANGALAGKVFKWKSFTLKPKERLALSRTHAIKPITTRKYYAGAHALSLRINGAEFGYEGFDLSL